MSRRTERNEWKFCAALRGAAPRLAALWWFVLVLPAAFAIAMGILIGGMQHGDPLAAPLALALVGAIFVGLQVVGPIYQALRANLGSCSATSRIRADLGPHGRAGLLPIVVCLLVIAAGSWRHGR